MEARTDREDDKKAPPKRRVMAVGVRRPGGPWWIRTRFRVEPTDARGARPASPGGRAA